MRVFFFMAILTCVPPLAGLALQPDQGSDLRLVIIAPWADGDALVQAAGGARVGPEQAPLAMFARTDDVQVFDSAARAAGAWWVGDGAALAALCGYTS